MKILSRLSCPHSNVSMSNSMHMHTVHAYVSTRQGVSACLFELKVCSWLTDICVPQSNNLNKYREVAGLPTCKETCQSKCALTLGYPGLDYKAQMQQIWYKTVVSPSQILYIWPKASVVQTYTGHTTISIIGLGCLAQKSIPLMSHRMTFVDWD